MQTLDLDAPLPDPATVLALQRAAWRERRRERLGAAAPGPDSEAWLAEAIDGLRLALAARDEAQAARCIAEALAFAVAMAQAAGWGGGRVQVSFADEALPEAALRPLRPSLALAALMAATLADDTAALARLAAMPSFELPANDGERFCLAAAIAWAALARQRPEAAREIAVAGALARDPHEQALVRALADLAHARPPAPPGDDGAPLEQTLAVHALAQWLGQPIDDLALAWRAGLAAQAPARPAVTCRAPLRAAPWPGEPAWWLDLYGGSGARTQRLVEDAHGRSVARCRVVPEDGGPVVEADFLVDPRDEAHDAAPRLDAGELAHLADCYVASAAASDADDEAALRRRRVALDVALGALEAALQRLPDGRPLAEADLPSALGRVRALAATPPLDRAVLERERQACAAALAAIDRRLALPAAATGATSTGEPADPSARDAALAAAALLRQQVEPLLQALVQDVDGRLAATLRPRAEDYAKAFRPEIAEAVRAVYEPWWADPPSPGLPDAGRRIVSQVCPAGFFADPSNPLARAFPGGYRGLAPLLDPHRVWVAWKAIAPGQSAGMAYDGLVWLDDHWAWFPKPYRVLQALVDTKRGASPAPGPTG